MFDWYQLTLWGLVVLLIHWLGLLTALHAMLKARTSQGAIAWAVSLILFPYGVLPLYWVFGRSRFNGYVHARRIRNAQVRSVIEQLRSCLPQVYARLEGSQGEYRLLESIVGQPFTGDNRVELLVDGLAIFDAMFAAIDQARNYVLLQFFIVHDDQIGTELKARLLRKAAEGVRIYFLYDEIGSHSLPGSYIRELQHSGVQMFRFRTARGWRNRFQLNFRNHRKVVVADGRLALVGGANVGDEYLGRNPRFGQWRDTYVRLEGPAVQGVQLSFLEDWYWAAATVPQWTWDPKPAGDQEVLIAPTGPADELETCSLLMLHVFQSARRRLWITSPYFVPDREVIAALQLAALRGVDVRVMLPSRPDHLLVYLSSFSFIEEATPVGVKFYRYQPGFLHQKVVLVDDVLALVGTANLDNRSFRLNFEITAATVGPRFAAEVEAMLVQDFARCRLAATNELSGRGVLFRLAVRLSRLMSPIQ